MNPVIWIVFTFAAFTAADPERERFHGSLEQKLNSIDTRLQGKQERFPSIRRRTFFDTQNLI